MPAKLNPLFQLIHCAFLSREFNDTSKITDLQLFSAIIFPASEPEVIVREIPTYDRDNLLSDCGGAAGLLLGLNIATLLGFLGK